MIKVRNIRKSYKKFSLNDISFEINRGEIVALIGANGAGKSTLIKCLCGGVKPDSGSIVVYGKQVKKLDEGISVGFLNQEQDVYGEIKIKELTNFICSVMKDKFDKDVYLNYFCDIFKLDEEYKIKELSTGMRVKYFISLELAKRPELLVLDEPTSGLDPMIREEVLDILREIAEKNGTTILFSSHITEDIEKIADRVMYIDDGNIMLDKRKEDVKKEYVQIDSSQYLILKEKIEDKKFVQVHDYYIVQAKDLQDMEVKGKEALLSDVLSYIRRGVKSK